MKRRLEEELIATLLPYFIPEKAEDAKLRIALALGKYEVKKEETALTVYEGDINENMLMRFLMSKAASGRSPRTIGYYRDSIKLTLEKIGKPYNQVTADDIRLYMAIRTQKDGVSKATANNERRNLSSFYTWLQNEEILLKNPMKKVETIKVVKQKKKAFTQMELEKIRLACKTARETAMVETLISTWARVSETAQIRIDEIEGNQVLVHGKGEKDRYVYLNPKAMLAIEVYLKERKDTNQYLFAHAKEAGNVAKFTRGRKQGVMNLWYTDPELVGTDHISASTIESVIRKIGARAGVKNTHPHRFRNPNFNKIQTFCWFSA